MFGFNRTLEGEPDRLAAGSASGSRAGSRIRCVPGRYFVNCWISRNRTQGDLALHVVRLLDFVVFGTRPDPAAWRYARTSTREIEDESATGRRGRRSTLELRDVRGPSALGGGRRRALELLLLIAVNEFKRTYLGTALGYLWSLARPLLLFGVLLVVFTQAFDLGDRVTHYPVLLLFNIVLFRFFQEATSQPSTRSSARSRWSARRSSRGS